MMFFKNEEKFKLWQKSLRNVPEKYIIKPINTPLNKKIRKEVNKIMTKELKERLESNSKSDKQYLFK